MSEIDVGELVTIDQVMTRAEEMLDPGPHGWAEAGAGEEITLTRNRVALNGLALVPRMGRDVSAVDTRTTFADVPLAMPVLLAPIGALALYDPADALAAAEAAAAKSISAFCSLLTTARWEEVAGTSPERHFFQLYALGDREWMKAILSDVAGMGFAGLCITMDAPVIGRRDRSLVDGFTWGTPPEGTVDLGRWDGAYRARFDWSELEWVCHQTDMPVIVKGVMTPNDAIRATECGARAVYVSNHGGRMVDHGISTIEVLQEIVEAVPDAVDVAVDSGFTRGAEVCKAIALGAKAVGLGRLQCWALAVGSTAGLVRVLEILAEELRVTMANLGCRDVNEVTADLVRWSIPVSPPPMPRHSGRRRVRNEPPVPGAG